MINVSLMCVMLVVLNPQMPPLLCAKRLVLPIYPKLAKLANDARVVSVKVELSDGLFHVVDIKGGNKYYDEAVRTAISSWVISLERPCRRLDFTVTFDFRVTEDPTKEGLCEVDFDEGKIVIWGLTRRIEKEVLPTQDRVPGSAVGGR